MKIIILILTIIILTGCTPKYDLSIMSDEDIRTIFTETSITTGLNTQAYKELVKRGYWDDVEREQEEKLREIFNKYK